MILPNRREKSTIYFLIVSCFAYHSITCVYAECHTKDTLLKPYLSFIKRILVYNVDHQLPCTHMCQFTDTSNNRSTLKKCSMKNSTTPTNPSVQNTSLYIRTYLQDKCNCSIQFQDMDIPSLFNNLLFPLICSLVEVFPVNIFEILDVNNKDSIVSHYETKALPLYVTAAVLAFIGIVGNIITICVIMCHPSSQTPTYRLFIHLAIGDILSIVLTFMSYFTGFTLAVLFCMKERYLLPLFYLLVYLCQENSSVQIVLVSILRYLIVVHPLKSRKHLTSRRVSYSSCLGSLISVVITTAVLAPSGKESLLGDSVSVFQSSADMSKSYFIFNICMTAVYTALLLTFHLLKIKQVSNSRSANQSTNNMIMTVTLLTGIYTIPAVAGVAVSVLSLALGTEWSKKNPFNIYWINIMWMIRYGANPFIYFFLSPPGKAFCSSIVNTASCFRKKF